MVSLEVWIQYYFILRLELINFVIVYFFIDDNNFKR